ncbi:transglutaminase-like domain-containing protein [Nocardioides sp. 503]|uniref:transglutaminase-like domain-containing protein n=1 Tax=Nocardioides sp. 503 TaxID=2508326 RepID=UPI0010700BD2|nr:transglutaminase-like domain-containing protein [Nocardioides sp. 503]
MSRLLPGRHDLVDAVLLLAACATALSGLATTYTGVGHLVVGLTGVVLGIVLAHVTTSLRWPGIAAVVLGIVVFVLVGAPLALHAAPGPSAVGELGDQVLFGWKDLLTTVPPVDGDGPLLVLPWVLGLVAGLLGTLTGRLRSGPVWLRAVLPVLVPAALLVAVILLGVARPQSVWLQGVVFTVLAIGWLALRVQRSSAPVRGGIGRGRRLALGAAMVGLAATAALPVATWATGSDDGRVVLRTYVEPPFDIGQYPSPLSSFRRYVKMPKPDAVNLHDKTLMTVEGAPEGARIRIAALDRYDGVVWGAAEDTVPNSSDDTFQRVSSTIDNPVDGDDVDVTVTLGEGYSGVWLPTVGALQSMEFEDGATEEMAESFRYNLATATAVVPSGLAPGDRYHFTAVRADDEVTATSVPSGSLGEAALAAGFLDTQAVQWSAGASEPMERVFAAAEHLRTEGKYSDGVLESEKIYHAGHHVRRLAEEFVNAPIMVGNDEQYAAVMALLANKIGVPARVVLGAVVPDDGVVQGKDVHAWVELQVADGSWRTLPTETFMDTDRPAEQPPLTEQEMSGTVVPPPAPIPPPSTLAEQNDAELNARKGDRDADESGGLPAWVRVVLLYVGLPLLVVVLLLSSVVLAKVLRRRRRRAADRMSARIVGAWRELVDHARDLGQPVPVGAGWTRREQSSSVASPQAPGLAALADRHVFGPGQPPEAAAASYWAAVDAERHRLSREVPRLRRLRAALSLRTFRRR